MKTKVFPIIFILFIFCSSFSFAEKFSFKYIKGDTYRILSSVHEDVFLNGQLHHHAEIVNRVSVEVTDVNNGIGTHKASFMTTESSVIAGEKKAFSWDKNYPSNFSRDSLGHYDISDEYFMPTVRDVPIFLDKDVKIGETWQEEGHEAHDLRDGFNLETPYKIPFTANYTYEDTVVINGKTYHLINCKYNLLYDSPKPSKDILDSYSDYPVTTRGYSDQNIYWDNEKGCIFKYNETFRIQIETAFGQILEYSGTADAEVTELKKINTNTTIEKVQTQIENQGIENTTVAKDDKGITISIENIQFKPNSAILLDSEKEKLKKIASILSQFSDNDLLISGHTALAGRKEDRQILSEQRANTVASYLISLGVKDEYHIFTQGFGAEKPIDTNTTIKGMERNRRVEITILQE